MSETVELTRISNEQRERIRVQRKLVSDGLLGKIPTLIVAKGQCSTNIRDIEITKREALDHRDFMLNTSGVFVVQRQNHIKQRTPRTDGSRPWEGMDRSHRQAAIRLHLDSVEDGTPLCMEITDDGHLETYTPGEVMAWIGALNRDEEFMVRAATTEKHLPLGVKPDKTGDPEWAFTMVGALNHIRETVDGTAPAFVIDRGGTDFDTPGKWEDQVKRNLERTNGTIMVDLAHGSEQAHDPDGNFEKSVEGQIRALEHYIEIGEQTGMWATSLMLEASDAPSDTDPNMPHQIALDGIAHIAQIMHPQTELAATQPVFDQEFPDESWCY